MARTLSRYQRFYMDGFDLSGDTRKIGPLKWEYDVASDAALTDGCKNALLDQASVSPGTLNGFFNNTATTGLHVVGPASAGGAGVARNVMVPLGFGAAPAAGDPVFCGKFLQTEYKQAEEGSYLVATLTFANAEATAPELAYSRPWGVLLHAKAAETGVYASTGVDDRGAATAAGGFMAYQLFTSDGTVTLKVQDAATNLDASFADLSGATSGVIDASVTPAAGIVALAATATVRRYLRWQLVFGTGATATFALAFVRI